MGGGILYGWSVPRLLRVVVISGIALATVLLVIAGTVVFVVRHSFPTYDGTIELNGLDAEVSVVRDTNGIPQIYADTPADLFAAQGYVHAQDRFFEMDFRRHVTSGRLTELFGETALETDKFVRTLGWRRVAEKELPLLSPTTRQYLDDYARGVNAYLSTHSGSGLSLEYGVLSLQPDLILAETSSGPQTALDQLAAAGVPIVVFDPADGIDSASTRIGAVAAALGVEDLGTELIARTEAGIAAATEGMDLSDPPRVAFLYLRGSASVYMIGARDSGATSLIEAAGGVDAGAEALEGDFLELTPEALAAAAPDVILVMDKGLDSVGGVAGLLEIPGVAQTPAGEQERIAHLPDGIMLNYGPRTGEVVADLARQLHGNAE